MNKKIVSLAIFGALMFSGVVNAQVQDGLPSAGIKPDSIFFFLDQFGESLQELFTFNAEAKAKLQIKFVGERIAEINALVEKKGPEARGIDKAETLLLGNVAHAAEIVKKEKASGKDVAKLAKQLDDEFDVQEKLLVQSFQDARKKLKNDRLALKKTLAEQAGDTSLAVSLENQINDLESQDNQLKDRKEKIKKSLRSEKKKIEDELDSEDKKTDEQDKLKEDKQEGIEEADIENEDKTEEVEKPEKKEKPEIKENDENSGEGKKDEVNKKDEEKGSDNASAENVGDNENSNSNKSEKSEKSEN